MPCILNIETSTDICSLAVTQDGECLFYREDHSGPNHAIKLGIFVEQALSYVDSRNMTLDAVAVSCGPGSYTGLRIGTSMAKGICYGRNIKLISVPTLEILAVPVLLYNDIDDGSLICPMLDARRMEVYAAIYDKALNEIRPIQADIVDAKGQFSVRGGIVDIGTTKTQGLRIEFWGDEVDSIRSFSITSQRSNKMLEEARIYPSHELIVTKNINDICKKIEV